MCNIAPHYLPNLNIPMYPPVIVAAITTITHGTATLYRSPDTLYQDLLPLLQASNVSLHCIISHFLDYENQHILVMIPPSYENEVVFSPGLLSQLEETFTVPPPLLPLPSATEFPVTDSARSMADS